MYGAFGTTIIQGALVATAMFIAGQVTGFWLESALVITSIALAISVWRRNQLYQWLQQPARSPITQVPGLWFDMTKRIQLREQALVREREQVQNLLANLHQSLGSLDAGLISLTSSWKIRWWNDTASELLGLRHQFDEDVSLFNLVRTPELADYAERLVFEESITLSAPSRSGQMLEYVVCPIQESGYLLVVRDVTRFTRLERMRRDFVSNVSHELKTPLTVIKGYLETILDNQLVSDRGVRAVEQAFKQADRMASLIQDLLLLSQLETTKPQQQLLPVRFDDLLDHGFNEGSEYSRALGKTETRLSIEGTLPLLGCMGVWHELASAMTNLVTNAIRYSPDGAMIQLKGFQNDRGVTLQVIDDGPGILPDHIPRLTERFYRVDNSHSPATGGTGLGLAIVKHILLRHRAGLEIDSTPGKGATFSCHFPAEQVIDVTVLKT
jgi:two-component system, OmpR family, phosphate regulon sensor histidine kinase PhoR